MSNTTPARTEYFAGRSALYDRIDGRVYDTDTAILIGETSNSNEFAPNNSLYWKAGLFRTPRSGRYFIAGVGGAMTPFAYRHDDGTRSGSTRIIPVDDVEAEEWSQEHLASPWPRPPPPDHHKGPGAHAGAFSF